MQGVQGPRHSAGVIRGRPVTGRRPPPGAPRAAGANSFASLTSHQHSSKCTAADHRLERHAGRSSGTEVFLALFALSRDKSPAAGRRPPPGVPRAAGASRGRCVLLSIWHTVECTAAGQCLKRHELQVQGRAACPSFLVAEPATELHLFRLGRLTRWWSALAHTHCNRQ